MGGGNSKRLKKENEILSSTVNTLRNQVHWLQQRSNGINNNSVETTALKNQANQLRNEKNKSEERVSELHRKNQSLVQEIEAMKRNKVNPGTAEIKSLKKENEILKNRINGAEQLIDDLKKDYFVIEGTPGGGGEGEGEGGEAAVEGMEPKGTGVNKFTYWVTNSPIDNWT